MVDFDKSMFSVTATAPQGAGDSAAAAAPPPEVKVFEDPPPEVGFSFTKFVLTVILFGHFTALYSPTTRVNK